MRIPASQFYRIILGIILCLFSSILTWAQADDHIVFNFDRMNKKLTSIDAQVTSNKKSNERLNRAIEKIHQMQDKARTCLEAAQAKTETLNNLLEAAKKELGEQKEDDNWSSLVEEKNGYAKKAADCRLFIFRSQELIKNYNHLLSELNTKQTLKKITHIGFLFNPENYHGAKLDYNKFISESGLGQTNLFDWFIAMCATFLGLSFGFIAKYYLERLNKQYEHKRIYLSFLLRSLKRYIYAMSSFTGFSLYFFIKFYGQESISLPSAIGYAGLLCTIMLFVAHIFLFRPKHLEKETQESSFIKNKFFNRLYVPIVALCLSLIVYVIIQTQPLSVELQEAIFSLFIIIMTLYLAYISSIVTEFESFQNLPYFMRVSFKSLLFAATFFIVSIEALGYHILGTYLVKSILLTVLISLAYIELIKFIEVCFDFVENPDFTLSKKFRKQLGLSPRGSIPEVMVMRLVLYSFLLFWAIIYLMKSWLLPVGTITQFHDAVFKEFIISGIKIYPYRIGVGFTAFCIVFLSARWLATYTSNHYKRWQDRDNKIALASIITYLGFLIAVIVGLLMSGVNFTGLAIVAGALSVGIGFGLQHFANNFISGVILLIQSPVRAGDRVVIDGVEGFVKKIKILSTQISTLAKEDVIIPNSDLLTNPVTNFMYADNLGRINCKVGVSYDSDVDLVKQTLEEIALQHDEILDDYLNKPVVYFTEFGDSALLFQVWCVIKDVNKRYVVRSDINTAIHKVFKEKQISIAYPQLDLHIKGEQPPASPSS